MIKEATIRADLAKFSDIKCVRPSKYSVLEEKIDEHVCSWMCYTEEYRRFNEKQQDFKHKDRGIKMDYKLKWEGLDLWTATIANPTPVPFRGKSGPLS